MSHLHARKTQGGKPLMGYTQSHCNKQHDTWTFCDKKLWKRKQQGLKIKIKCYQGATLQQGYKT